MRYTNLNMLPTTAHNLKAPNLTAPHNPNLSSLHEFPSPQAGVVRRDHE